jgi:hypothetical protein
MKSTTQWLRVIVGGTSSSILDAGAPFTQASNALKVICSEHP